MYSLVISHQHFEKLHLIKFIVVNPSKTVFLFVMNPSSFTIESYLPDIFFFSTKAAIFFLIFHENIFGDTQ